MAWCNKFVNCIGIYQTPKLVTIHSRVVGVISNLVQLLVAFYVFGYVIVVQKGYQDFSNVESSVTTKVKGVAYTKFADDEFFDYIKNKSLYRRIWDSADYVIPPSENGAIFVATNVVITPDQVQSTCAEHIEIHGAACDPDNNTCEEGKLLHLGNGIMTGKCVESPLNITIDNKTHSCEVRAWCPVEDDRLPLKNEKAILQESENFTLLIKNFVDFPKFDDSTRRNMKDTGNRTYLENCLYDETNNFDCPVFRLGDIVKWAGCNYNDLAYKGAVVAIAIHWNCDFDWGNKKCFPTYSFTRLDDPGPKLAHGWNFRYAEVYGDYDRTLYKLFGIKFAIIVRGQAGKFAIIPLLLNVGAGFGLLSLEVLICDLVVLYLMRRRNYYKSKKYEDTAEGERDSLVVVVQPTSVPTLPRQTPSRTNFAEGYERLEDEA